MELEEGNPRVLRLEHLAECRGGEARPLDVEHDGVVLVGAEGLEGGAAVRGTPDAEASAG